MKQVKMVFAQDKFVDGVLTFEKNKVVLVNETSVNRWLIRDGYLAPEGAKEGQEVSIHTEEDGDVKITLLGKVEEEKEEAKEEKENKSSKPQASTKNK